MKLGVLTVPFQDMSAEKTFEFLHSLGVQAVELGTGGYTNKNHCDPDVLLADEKKLDALRESLAKNDLVISALSCHGNAVHPNKDLAKEYHRVYVNTCKLAQKLGVDTVVTFSGCPGDSEASLRPNWVTCAWPEDYLETQKYQWNDVLIPYWKEAVKVAEQSGVKKVAFEMHPGFCVYNPETMLKLREAVSPILGANFDPSHLIWQGIDPVRAIYALKDCLYHFHAKDTRMDAYNTSINGVLDTKHYSDAENRSWVFRTIGYGNDEKFWRDIVSALRTIGYDGVMSIEHEDGLMSPNEGMRKAITLLKGVMTFEDKGKMYWA